MSCANGVICAGRETSGREDPAPFPWDILEDRPDFPLFSAVLLSPARPGDANHAGKLWKSIPTHTSSLLLASLAANTDPQEATGWSVFPEPALRNSGNHETSRAPPAAAKQAGRARPGEPGSFLARLGDRRGPAGSARKGTARPV